MKCPLLVIGYLSVPDKEVNRKSECLKESCAWWVKTTEECAISKISQSLFVLAAILKVVRDRMVAGGEG